MSRVTLENSIELEYDTFDLQKDEVDKISRQWEEHKNLNDLISNSNEDFGKSLYFYC